ncbi:hypothetical protein Tco_0407358 [Tanacetum coccineum]
MWCELPGGNRQPNRYYPHTPNTCTIEISSPISSPFFEGLLDLASELLLINLHFLVAPEGQAATVSFGVDTRMAVASETGDVERVGDMMRYGLLQILWGRQSQLTPNILETKPLYVGTVHWNSWGDEGHLRSRGNNSGVASLLRRQGAASQE